MDDFFSRSEAILGAEVMEQLRNKRVLLIGVGGVGSWAAEALIRTGLSHLTIMDGDVVQPSNINRQLPATRQTIGQSKVLALRERLLTINPDAEVVAIHEWYREPHPDPLLKEREEGMNGERREAGGERFSANDEIIVPKGKELRKGIDLASFDYLIDAIDNVADKTHLLINASRVRTLKVFSSMGAALRFDPTQVRVAELFDVKGDALAKAVRERMKRLGLKPSRKIQCVYSLENAVKAQKDNGQSDKVQSTKEQSTKGSLMQVTAVFGCTLASLVIEDIRKKCVL